ncbi:hypothetical protein [Azospirillum sp. sgz302134]
MARKTIVALYDSRAEAEAAQRDLLDAGFDDLTVDVVFDGGFGGSNDFHGGLFVLLSGWGVPNEEAHDYAEAVRQGGALLVVSLTRESAIRRALDVLEPGGVRSAPLGQAATAMRGVNAGPAVAPAPPPAPPVEPARTETVRAGVYPAPDAEPGPTGRARP